MSNLANSKYVQYLPVIYQKGFEESDEKYFLGRFLKAFEQVLSGIPGTEGEETFGIEALLDRFDRYFDPSQTPAQFLPWLAGWVDLNLEEDLEFYGEEDNAEKSTSPVQLLPLNKTRTSINRSMIEKIVGLYKKRGTWEGLLEYLQIYAGDESTINIDEFGGPTRIGKSNRVGVNTMVGYASPCYFSAHALIPAYSRSAMERKVQILREVIEKEKPFYTNYTMSIELPAMRVGVYARVGRETLVGGMVEK